MEQLYKKVNGEYIKVYPLNYIENILDSESGKTLASILSNFNNISLPYQDNAQDTRALVPQVLRRKGLWITYNNGEDYITEYYKGTASDIQEHWTDDYNWEVIPSLKYVQEHAGKLPDGIITPSKLSPALLELIKQNNTITNLPDDEDLEEVNSVLRFKDRSYQPELASGKGYKILRKNWTKVGDKTINLLTQDMINEPNTRYVIQYDFDLNDAEITIPEGCILDFQGGNFYNGTIIGTNTKLFNFVDIDISSNPNILYKGNFYNTNLFVYFNIEEVKKYVHFPGQNIKTTCFNTYNDRGGCQYIVKTKDELADENKYFLDYWVYTKISGGYGCYVNISDNNYNSNLWLKYNDNLQEINLSIFNIKYDALYLKDNKYYSDKEHTKEATDNSDILQGAIGQLAWWSNNILPRTLIISGRININKPIHLYHGAHYFVLKGDIYQKGQIITNNKIDCLFYNIYDENSTTALTGTGYYIERVYFDALNNATDCIVIKNGSEADTIHDCHFYNAKNAGIRLFGISSTFRLTSVSCFDNKYGVLITNKWTFNNIEYTNMSDGLHMLDRISGDNNEALVAIDTYSYGGSINITNIKCEDRSSNKEGHCTIKFIHYCDALGVCVNGGFSNTTTPYIIIENDTDNNLPNIILNNIFNNNCSDEENPNTTILIEDKKYNKIIRQHASGNSTFDIIYTNNYSDSIFKHGKSFYRNGNLIGAIPGAYGSGVINLGGKQNRQNIITQFEQTPKNISSPTSANDMGDIMLFNKGFGEVCDCFGNIVTDGNNILETINIEINNTSLYKYFGKVSNSIYNFVININEYRGRISLGIANSEGGIIETYNNIDVDADGKYNVYFTIPQYIDINEKNIFIGFEGNGQGTATINKIRFYNIYPLIGYLLGHDRSYNIRNIGNTENRPTNPTIGFQYFDTTLNKPVWWNDTKWIDSNGNDVDVKYSGTTLQRPTNVNTAFQYFDTDLNKPIYWTGSKWVDATGADVDTE